jgi:predicted flavoprotein YhiN
MNLTAMRLSGYAQSMGFESETERFLMIESVPQYKYAELDKWMNEDGRKETLQALLSQKRPVRPSKEAE